MPVIESTTQHGVFARLQHDVAAHKPPDGSPAVSEEAADRQGARAVEGDPEEQQAQVQEVSLGRVPAPDHTQERTAVREAQTSWVLLAPP